MTAKRTAMLALALLLAAGAAVCGPDGAAQTLPPLEEAKGEMAVEQAIAARRSVRRFKTENLAPAQVGRLVWAAQGITHERRGYRASPSAGALYPMELYVVSENGVHKYLPADHALRPHKAGDVRAQLARAALGQQFIAQAPITLAIAAVYERTTRRYGERGRMYVHMEAGHIGQNVHLQAVALGLGSVPVGAFSDEEVSQVLSLPDGEVPLYLITVGHPAE